MVFVNENTWLSIYAENCLITFLDAAAAAALARAAGALPQLARAALQALAALAAYPDYARAGTKYLIQNLGNSDN